MCLHLTLLVLLSSLVALLVLKLYSMPVPVVQAALVVRVVVSRLAQLKALGCRNSKSTRRYFTFSDLGMTSRPSALVGIKLSRSLPFTVKP